MFKWDLVSIFYLLTIIYFCVNNLGVDFYEEDCFSDVVQDANLDTVASLSDWMFDDDGYSVACLYIGNGISSHVSTLSELFLEWYLFDSNEKKDISKFLKTEELEKVFTEKQFMDLMCGDAYVCDDIARFLYDILPFKVGIDKIYRLNALARKKRGAYEVKLSSFGRNYVAQYSSSLRATALEERRKRKNARAHQKRLECGDEVRAKVREYLKRPEVRKRVLEYQRAWRKAHSDEINARARQKRQDNGDEVRAKQRAYMNRPDVKPRVKAARAKYREKNRDTINARERARRSLIRDQINAREKERRAANIEHCRELSRANAKRYAERHKDKVRKYRKSYDLKYRLEHQEELAVYKHQYNQEHSQEIADKKRAIREKTNDISTKCPTFMFIKLLKKVNPIAYIALYGKYQNPALPAIKECDAVKTMDFSKCPILQNVNVQDKVFSDKCALSHCMSVPDSVQQIRQIAMGLVNSK